MANGQPRYYDITCACERFQDSPRATAYLDNIIEESSPDNFSWVQYDEARHLALLDEREGKTLP